MALTNGFMLQRPTQRCLSMTACMLLSLFVGVSSIAAPIPEDVQKAIVKGSDYLIKTAEAEGDGFYPGIHSDKIGNTALPVYALIKCGEPLDHPAIMKSLPHLTEYAMKVKPDRDEFFTYNAATILLTLDAVRDVITNKKTIVSFRKRNESTRDANAKIVKRRKTKINVPRLVALIRKLAMTLARTQNKDGGFGYKPGSRSDLSNTQYAVLGMWAARRSGFKLNKQGLMKIADWVMSIQNRADKDDPKKAWTPTAAEFLYGGDDRPASAIMTGAGIGTLAVIHFELTKKIVIRRGGEDEYRSPGEQPLFRPAKPDQPGGKKPKRVVITKKVIKHPQRIQRAIDDGFKWWEESGFAIDNAYHLYTLERACALTKTSEINGKDWYSIVSKHAVKTQNDDGSWANYNNDKNLGTSWTLLFLVRATSQIIDRDPAMHVGSDSLGEKPGQ